MYKYNMGGSVPRETNIAGQRHSLAYINPFEEDLLNTQYRGGEGQPVPPVPGPGGVPSYPSVDDGYANKKTTEEASKVAPPSNPGDRSGSGNAAFDNLQEQMTNSDASNTGKRRQTLTLGAHCFCYTINNRCCSSSSRGSTKDN